MSDATTTTAPSKDDLIKAVNEAKSALDAASKKATETLAAESAKGADADFTALQSAAGAKTRAETALKNAEAAVKDFDANQRWNGLRDTNRPIIDLLSATLKAPITITASMIRGDVTITDSGEPDFSGLRFDFSDPSTDDLKAKLTALFKAGLAGYKAAGVKEIHFSADSKGVSIGPKTSTTSKPKTASTTSTSGTRTGRKLYNGLGASDYLNDTMANAPEFVSKRAASFDNFVANGSKMNGLSNLAGDAAAFRGHEVTVA